MTPADTSSPSQTPAARRLDRAALAITLALLWINLATTGRWAAIPGALHGARLPWYAAALAITTILAFRRPAAWWGGPEWLPRVVLVSGVAILACSFLFVWMPIGAWTQVPFLDDWPPRFWSTVEGVRLMRHGALVGWQWNFLGGYSTASDITQSLTILGALPMAIFGPAVGFHLLHLVLFLALPAIVFVDLSQGVRPAFRQAGPDPVIASPAFRQAGLDPVARLSRGVWPRLPKGGPDPLTPGPAMAGPHKTHEHGARNVALLAAGLVALSACGLSWSAMRSGDTNSLAGLVCVMATLAASHRARSGARLGFTLLVAMLAATTYSHVGFFAYGAGLLLLEAIYYRDAAHLRRGVIAAILAVVISLPLTFELFRYPSFFNFNNVLYTQPAHIDWAGVVRKIFYNVEILFLPQRWFNDAAGLTNLFLPLLVLAAWRRESRAGFYAWAALFAVVLMRFNVPEAGYVFARPVHLLVVFTPVVLAWFITTRAWSRELAVALTAVVGIGVQIAWFEVPHQPSVDAFLPSLVHQIAASDGNLVLVENNPHRDVVASPTVSSEPSLYGTHYEALLAGATGRRFYAGSWDGWQWTPYRGEMLAGGAWEGHMLGDADHAAFVAEMRKWGVRHLFVWSDNAVRTLGRWPEFADRRFDDRWHQFDFTEAPVDARAVTTDHGSGDLASTDLLGGVVRLHDVQAGDHVVVRTHFHPSWEAEVDGHAIATADANGQLAVTAPHAGSYDVTLVYPKRTWLLFIALGTIVGVGIIEFVTSRR